MTLPLHHGTIEHRLEAEETKARARGADPEKIYQEAAAGPNGDLFKRNAISDRLAVLQLANRGYDFASARREYDPEGWVLDLPEIAGRYDEIDKLRAEIVEHSALIATMRGEIREMEEKIAAAKAECTSLREKIANFVPRVSAQERVLIDGLRSEIASLHDALGGLRSELSSLNAARKRAHSQLLLLLPMASALCAVPAVPGEMADKPDELLAWCEANIPKPQGEVTDAAQSEPPASAPDAPLAANVVTFREFTQMTPAAKSQFIQAGGRIL